MTIVRELIKPLECGMDIPQGLSLSCPLVFSSRERVVHFQGPYFSQKKHSKSLNLTFWTFIAVAYVKYSLV